MTGRVSGRIFRPQQVVDARALLRAAAAALALSVGAAAAAQSAPTSTDPTTAPDNIQDPPARPAEAVDSAVDDAGLDDVDLDDVDPDGATFEDDLGASPWNDPMTGSEASNTADEDPWEGFNRAMFSANTFVDDNLITPISLIYRATTPKRGRRGLRRFLANLRAPVTLINDVLQGEFGRAGETAARFFINSTIGAGGFADPASALGVPAHTEDFGQTLAVWGVGPGPYIVFPLLGPSTARDLTGAGVQVFFDPHFYFRSPPANVARFTRAGVGGIATRETVVEPLAEMRANSLDYYAALRSFYLQSREREILNGATNFEDLPDIGDFDDLDDFDDIE